MTTTDKQIQELKIKIAQLQAALENYGVHLDHCPAYRDKEDECVCGLDAALEGALGPQEEQ
jgi:hypothetical protein